MIKDNVYQFLFLFLEKISFNSFNIFIFIYFRKFKIFLLKHVLLHFK